MALQLQHIVDPHQQRPLAHIHMIQNQVSLMMKICHPQAMEALTGALWTFALQDSTPCPMVITDPAIAPHHHSYLNDRLYFQFVILVHVTCASAFIDALLCSTSSYHT